MRLNKIKIAGFKSFVDPTTIDLRSNLTGIVGPNGCGKSNTIDAVRWVMGESSAKHLRGDSMDDVIFNGSSARKPIGQASIELLFDNTDASLGGEYAKFAEIGIKRLITRDGQSKYFLNSTRCRRRDITDIFLGTGLGPRSYAIIEQGMIGRLIEAKPEELRNTLEEAAGISKYKDRRRETERRIKHTRENLDRLSDLREELEKQLSHLNRQAKAAEKYKTFKQEERQTTAELILLRLDNVREDSKLRQQSINESATKHQAALSEQRSLENQIESRRKDQTDANEKLNETQASYYQIGSEISRIEQTIQHQKELEKSYQRELEQIENEIKSAEQHVQEDQLQLSSAEQNLEKILPELEEQQKSLEKSNLELHSAEESLSLWQKSWNDLQQKLSEPAQQAQVERARMEQLENQILQIVSRLNKLQSDQGVFNTDSQKKELSEQQSIQVELKEKSVQAQKAFDNGKRELLDSIESTKSIQHQIQKTRSELQALNGQLSSLEVLQKAALGQDKKNKFTQHIKDWFTKHSLEDSELLTDSIQIESGWEKALETVLGDLIESKQIGSHIQLNEIMQDVPDTNVSFFIDKNTDQFLPQNSLAAKVNQPTCLQAFLLNFQCAETMNEALQQQKKLHPNEIIVTKDGSLLGFNWIKTHSSTASNPKEGLLARKKQIESVKSDIENQNQHLEKLELQLEETQSNQTSLEERQTELQSQLNTLHREESQVQSTIHATENRIKQTESNQQRIAEEIIELELQRSTQQETHDAATRLRNNALSQLETLEKEKTELEGKDTPLFENVSQLRSSTQVLREKTQNSQLQVETYKTMQASAKQQLSRLSERQTELHERKQKLINQNNEIDQVNNEELSKTLEQQLDIRNTVEKELSVAREALQGIDNDIRDLDQKRNQAEQQVEQLRSKLETLKLEWQEVSVREKTLQEQIDETEFDAKALLISLQENSEITLATHQAHLEGVQRKISRLGAINLAAIDEFKTQSERKVYLDQQDQDLNEALSTLETAIAKIDKDTRSQFKETFEKVNNRIQEMFPQLFGGGKAHLEMTGDDLLTTGIAIMAQPPGKRISSIHLMSGGEKALTAVALVFAIFELNPAPFCMLDEVDAPLDEANVGRFCELVRKMSDRVQFIFITHNKTTMEMAENLVGVTMREPGISRLVSVDVNEAARMAQE